MGNYSKLIAAIVGPLLGFGVANFGLPADWGTEAFSAAVVTVMSGLLVYVFPANKTAE